MDDAVRQKSFEMFTGGASVNTVAKALFKGAWAASKKAKTEWEKQGGASSAAAAGKPGRRKKVIAEAVAETLAWDVPVRVPTDRLDAILLSFETSEKADAIGFILQQRMDAVLA